MAGPRSLIAALSMALLLGCGAARRPKESFAKIQPGMSQAQVEQTLGKPDSIVAPPENKTMENWTYSDKDWVNFQDGKVIAVVYDSQTLGAPVPPEPATASPSPLASSTPAHP